MNQTGSISQPEITHVAIRVMGITRIIPKSNGLKGITPSTFNALLGYPRFEAMKGFTLRVPSNVQKIKVNVKMGIERFSSFPHVNSVEPTQSALMVKQKRLELFQENPNSQPDSFKIIRT